MNELLALISATISYAMESPQNFVVVCGFVGWVGLFVKPMERTVYKAKPTPRKGDKRKAATNRKTRTVQKPAKKAKPQKWAKPPKYTPRELDEIENYYRKRDQRMRVNKNDNWAGYGSVPL